MNDDKGFVLITALLIMVVLTIIGIAATTNTSLELQIAGNDKVHKQAFYGAEGAAILGVELLEQNLNCPTGFKSGAMPDWTTIEPTNYIAVNNSSLDFARNPPSATPSDILDNDKADINFPLAFTDSATPDSYLMIGGAATMLPGGSLQMAAGYEGVGKSAAGGGIARFYDIYARHQGADNSQSIIILGWRHIVGNESTCNY